MCAAVTECFPILLNNRYARSRTQGFGPEVQRRILLGTYALSAKAYAAYYQAAVGIREQLVSEFEQAFREVRHAFRYGGTDAAKKWGAY